MKLEVKDLCFSYGKREVVRNITFTANAGEVTAILGVNGVGKSTLLKCVSRIHRPRSGEILLDGENAVSLSRRELARRVAYVAQSCEFADSTVFDAVLLGRLPFVRWDVTDRDLAAAREALDTMGLSSFAMRSVRQLSGGERQRVALARALAQQSPVLLLDEPTSSLDLNRQLEALSTIREIVRQKRLTAIVTIHDLNLALRFADRFLLLKEGEPYGFGGAELITPESLLAVYGVRAAVLTHSGRKVIVPERKGEKL